MICFLASKCSTPIGIVSKIFWYEFLGVGCFFCESCRGLFVRSMFLVGGFSMVMMVTRSGVMVVVEMWMIW